MLALIVSGCSDRAATDSAGQPAGEDNQPAVTTIDVTVNDQPVDLTGAESKCYDHEGHLSVEAYDPDDSDVSHFLMDYYQNEVALSISVQGGDPDLFQYEPGTDGQTAKVTRDGDSVSVTGTIGVADSSDPRPFSITANCAKFFDTPPDSSKVDSSDLPSIPSTCPPGEIVCYQDGN
ncbi:hypothetical protein GCM10027436_84980 [Actinophytocola sediminis]